SPGQRQRVERIGGDLPPGRRRGAAAGQGRGGAAVLLLLADAVQALLKLVLLRHGRLPPPVLSASLCRTNRAELWRPCGAMACSHRREWRKPQRPWRKRKRCRGWQ